MPDIALTYRVTSPTLRRFHQSKARFRGVRGGLGSGKTTAMIAELGMRAGQQAPGPDGIRRTRFACIRNTAPELLSTTIRSFVQWFPEGSGKWSFDSPITFRMRRGDVDCEFIFLACDTDADTAKLLSLEITGAWLHEARELEKSIVDAVSGRVGRYPARRDGGAVGFIIADTNAPDTTHWWYILAERDEGTEYGRGLIESTDKAEAALHAEGLLLPDQKLFEFFAQPSGRSGLAENLEHLEPGYYTRLMAGKDADWIKVYVDGEYGQLVEGRAVFPQYRDSVHVATEPLEAVRGIPLTLGADWGRNAAAVIGQRLGDGRWIFLSEVTTFDTSMIRFAELLVAHVRQHYPNHDAEGFGDPSGLARTQANDDSWFEIMRAHTPWRWRPAPSNNVDMRLEVVRNALSRLVDGKPGLLISPRCSMLPRAYAGGYRYKQQRTGSGISVSESPDKNEFSHIADASGYALLGLGEISVVLQRQQQSIQPLRFADGVAESFFNFE